VLAGQDLAGDLAAVVQLVERDRVHVRRDLEDGVGGGVDDPLAGPLVLLAQLLDDLRPRGGLVPQHAAPGPVHERVDHFEREAVAVRRQCLRRDDPHHLPVARGRVLALRALHEPAGDRGRSGLRRAPFQRLDVAETERLEIREVEPADGARDVPQCVGAFVAELGRVGKLSRANRVQHDHACAGHGAILGWSWVPSSG
jgi:hypothetical protein